MNTGGNTDVGRLAARTRWRNMVREQRATELKVALLASYTVDPLVPYLGTALADAGIEADLWVGPYNQVERQCLDADSETAGAAPGLVVVAPRLEELWAGLPLPLDGTRGEYESGPLYLVDACVDAARRWGSELVFVLPAIPESRPAGVGDDGNTAGVHAVAAHAREAMRQRLAGHDHVAVVDAEILLRAIGGRHAYRPSLLAAARIPFSEEFFDALARRIARVVVLRYHRRPPLIVLDATSLGRSEPRQPLSENGGATGDPVTSLESYLVEATRLGATVALCNTTDDSRTWQAHLPVVASRQDDRTCAAQIGDLVRESSTVLDRVAFLSADPAAAAEVDRVLPEVTTLLLPPDPESWARALDDSGVVDQIPPPSAASAATGGTPGPALTLDSFLDSLGLTVDCSPLTADAGENAADLTRRVAEFHSTGEVWTSERFTERIGRGDDICWGISARDRFGDHGLCGIVVGHAVADVLTVDLWVLTCPVLGKGIEQRVLSALAAWACDRGCAGIAFSYRPTPRNGAFHRFLSGLAPTPIPGDEAGTVEVPVTDLERRQASATRRRTPAVVSAVAARRPKRRPSVAAREKGRFVTASQILQAVESRSPRREPVADGAVLIAPRNEAEEILADAFAGVLGVRSIGVDHNFFASGGDSMLAVRVIAKANQAGLRVTLRQVFKHQTVAELAAVATRVRREVTGAEDAGPGPILPSQAWFFGLGLPKPDHFNQSQRFEVLAEVDPDAVRRAVASLLERHQALRMRFHRADGDWVQSDPGPPKATPYTHVLLDDTAEEQWQDAITAHEAGMQTSMSPAEGRLFQVALFTFGGRRSPLILVICHHLAVDGISWRILLANLEHAIRPEPGAVVAPAAPAGMPVLTWAKRLSEYARSEEVRAELPKWLAESRTLVEPLPADVPGAGGGAFTHSAEIELSTDETRSLRERAVLVDHVSLDVLTLTAVVRALARSTRRGRFLVDVVNHGREPFIDGVDVSGTVGWLNVNVPVLLDVEMSAAPDELVPVVEHQLRDGSSSHGLGDNLLRYLADDPSVRARITAMPKADVLFAYIGDVDSGTDERPLLSRVSHGGELDMDESAGTPYALQFNMIVIRGRLVVEIYYHGTRYFDSTVQTLLGECAGALRELVATKSPETRS